MKSESPGSPAWNNVWSAGTFNSSTTLASATRSSSLRSSNILMLARKLGSQGIRVSSLRSRQVYEERRHYNPSGLKSDLLFELNSRTDGCCPTFDERFRGSFCRSGKKRENQKT